MRDSALKDCKPSWGKRALVTGVAAGAVLASALACSGGKPAPTPPVSPTAPVTVPATPTLRPTSTSAPTARPTGVTALPTQTPTPTRPIATPTPTVTPTPLPPTPTPTPYRPGRRGGTLRERATGYPATFDAQQAWSDQDLVFTAKFYNNLLWDPFGTGIECDVCDFWAQEDGGRTLSFTVKRGIRFQDGRDLTARDVHYSLAKLMGLVDGTASPGAGSLKGYVDLTVGSGDGISTPDAYTVKLHLLRPSAFVPKVLATASSAIVPEGTTAAQLVVAPFGSGPFRVKQQTAGDSVLMERNPDYFRPGLPYLDQVQVTAIRDEAVAYSAFAANKTDWSPFPGGIATPVRDTFDAMKQQGRVTGNAFLSGCAPQGVVMNVTKPPFHDPKVRHAINLALDRRAYLEAVLDGRGSPALAFDIGGASGLRAEDVWDKLPGWATGPSKEAEAEQALRVLVGAYPDGIDIEEIIENTPAAVRQAQFVDAALASIGVRGIQRRVDRPDFVTLAQTGNYGFLSYSFCQATGDPDEVWSNLFVTGGSHNWSGYSNPRLDDLYLQQSQEADPVKRRQLNREMESIVLADLPLAPLPDFTSEQWYWTYVKNYTLGVTAYTAGSNRHEDWWLDK